MKKLSAFILICAVLLSCALPAFAQELGYKINSVGCVTSQTELTEIYILEGEEEDVKCVLKYLPPKSKVTVSSELTDPEEMTAAGFDTKDRYYAFVSSELGNGYVEARYLTPEQDAYSVSNAYPAVAQYNYSVIDKSGAIIRKGPSVVYDAVGRIPYGAEFDVIGYDTDDQPSYGYVKYGDVEGWVYLYDYAEKHSVCYKTDSSSYLAGQLDVVAEGVYLADINADENGKYKRLTEDIPVGTRLKFNRYCFTSAETEVAALTTYEGTEGWLLFSTDTNTADASYVIPYVFDVAYIGADSPLYAENNDLSSATGEKIPAGSVVNLDAFYKAKSGEELKYWLCVEYGGKKQWITAGADSSIGISSGHYALAYVSADSIKLYGDFDFEKEPADVLYYGERLTFFASVYGGGLYWYCANANGKAGLIRKSENAFKIFATSSLHALRVDEDGQTVLGVNEYFEDPGVQTTASPDETAEEPEEKKEVSAKKILIISGIVIFVAAAAAFSTVTTLRGNKKKEEENQPE